MQDPHLMAFGGTSETSTDNVLYSLKMLSDGSLQFFHENGSGSDVAVTTDSGVLTQGDWAHVAATHDTALDQITFFVNGAEVAKVPFNGDATGGEDAGLLFGSFDQSDDFNGLMDEARVWNSVKQNVKLQRIISVILAKMRFLKQRTLSGIGTSVHRQTTHTRIYLEMAEMLFLVT